MFSDGCAVATCAPARVSNGSASPIQTLLLELLSSSIILDEDWKHLTPPIRTELLQCPTAGEFLSLAVKHKLLTEYQARRVEAGATFGLVLGQYRLLDRLGAGGMAVVFKGEHILMRRLVALKVLSLSSDQDPDLLQRFFREMRAGARLHHPNIVSALDAGVLASPDSNKPTLYYFVTEYVPGQDLEELVRAHGPLPPARACEIAYQVACALCVVAKNGLVHRDIKPSNVLLTPQGEAKLLDFGLARRLHCGLSRTDLTGPGAILGTLDYMAPEQADDSTAVDIRADIYGLGGTLFWCLTGEQPFRSRRNVAHYLAERITKPAPSVRQLRPELSEELSEVVRRMMAADPGARYPTPEAVMQAMVPFVDTGAQDQLFILAGTAAHKERPASRPSSVSVSRKHLLLIVDADCELRTFCRRQLEAGGLACGEASDAEGAIEALSAKQYDVMLLDVQLPASPGTEILRWLREQPSRTRPKLIMMSGMANAEAMAQMLSAGADDYLTKPLSLAQLRARVQAALRLKDAEDQAAVLAEQLRTMEAGSAYGTTIHQSAVSDTAALVATIASLTQSRGVEGTGQFTRLPRYCRVLAEQAAESPAFSNQVSDRFIEQLVRCAPLRDIGKLTLPDHVLMKPGKLSTDERLIVETHVRVGADIILQLAQVYRWDAGFRKIASDVVRHHHERYDGTGYPDQLAGQAIPLASRIVAIADSYDALRLRRSYRPGFSHCETIKTIIHGSHGQFDPGLLRVFEERGAEFEKIFDEVPD